LVGIRLASYIYRKEKEWGMSLMIKEFAFSNLFIIWLVILGGFTFLRIVKRQLEDW
jgi:hypothetical protein